MGEPSLEELQRIVQARKNKGEVETSNIPGPDVAIDKEGKIVVVDVTPSGVRSQTQRPVSQVPKDTFASISNRLEQENAFVRSNMPSGTYRLNQGTITGWVYEINTGTPYYDNYTLFVFFDSGYYYVMLAQPEDYPAKYGGNVSQCHLFSSGKLCLTHSPGGGYPEMEKSYSKSVMWAKGFSEYIRTGKFPFQW